MTADLYSFAIPFMADRSSVFLFDFEKRLGSFFLGVSPLGKQQKRKMSQPPMFAYFSLLGTVVSVSLGTGHWESEAGRPLDGGGLPGRSSHSLQEALRELEGVLL